MHLTTECHSHPLQIIKRVGEELSQRVNLLINPLRAEALKLQK